MSRRTSASFIIDKPSLIDQTYILTTCIGKIPLLPTETSLIERYTSQNIGVPLGSIRASRYSTVLQGSVVEWSLFGTTAVVVFLEIGLIDLTHHYTFCYCEIVCLPGFT